MKNLITIMILIFIWVAIYYLVNFKDSSTIKTKLSNQLNSKNKTISKANKAQCLNSNKKQSFDEIISTHKNFNNRKLFTTYEYKENITFNNEDIIINRDPTTTNYNSKTIPQNGSFFKGVPDFNITLPEDFKIEMVFIGQTAGLDFPDELSFGEYEENSIHDSVNKDFYGFKWNFTEHDISYQSVKISEESANKIKQIYIRENKLLDYNNTTDFLFIAPQKDTSIYYTKSLVRFFYSDLNKQKNITDIFSLNPYFDLNLLNSSIWNKELKYPEVAILNEDYTYKKFGYDIPYVCEKFNNWRTYASNLPKLLDYYNKNFQPVIDVFIEYFKDKPTFYDLADNEYLNISQEELKGNLTLNYILLDTLIADYYRGIDISNFIPDQGGISIIFAARKFLLYEQFLHSDIHTFLIISRIFDLFFDQFNKKINLLSGGNIDNVTDFEKGLKIIWTTCYRSTIAALYKIMSYDAYLLFNKNNVFISQPSTWGKSFRKNDIIDFPNGDYGESFHFELVSVKNKDNKKDFYLAMRQNFNSGYLLVLPVDIFNKLSKLFMMSPLYSENERSFFCKTN